MSKQKLNKRDYHTGKAGIVAGYIYILITSNREHLTHSGHLGSFINMDLTTFGKFYFNLIIN